MYLPEDINFSFTSLPPSLTPSLPLSLSLLPVCVTVHLAVTLRVAIQTEQALEAMNCSRWIAPWVPYLSFSSVMRYCDTIIDCILHRAPFIQLMPYPMLHDVLPNEAIGGEARGGEGRGGEARSGEERRGEGG